MKKLPMKPTMKKEHQTMQMNLWESQAQAEHEKRQTETVAKYCKASRLLKDETDMIHKMSVSVDRVKESHRRAKEKMDKAHALFKDGNNQDSDTAIIEANWLLNDARIRIMIELQKLNNSILEQIKDNPNKIVALFPQPNK